MSGSQIIRNIVDNDERYYKLGRKLGEGGFGAVYEAIRLQAKPGETEVVACKVKTISDQTNAMYHLRELDVWYKASQRTQHVARLFDASYNHRTGVGRIYMELLKGGDAWKFSDSVQKRGDAIHPLLLCIIAYQTAHGLEEIHQKGILHRDLKPDNVLLTKKITPEMNNVLWELSDTGTVRGSTRKAHLDELWNTILGEKRLAVLTDFGVSRDLTAPTSSQGRLTKMGGFSAAYNAPEMVGDNVQSQAADVFSFGMIVYILATFHFPKDARNRKPLPKIYSSSLQKLVDDCTRDTKNRRPTASQVVSALATIKDAEQAKVTRMYTSAATSSRAADPRRTEPSRAGTTSRVPQGRTAEHQRLIDADMEQMRRERERSTGQGQGASRITQGMSRLRVDDHHSSSHTRHAGHTPYASSQQASRPASSGARHVRPEDVPRNGGTSSRTAGGSSRSARDRIIEVYYE